MKKNHQRSTKGIAATCICCLLAVSGCKNVPNKSQQNETAKGSTSRTKVSEAATHPAPSVSASGGKVLEAKRLWDFDHDQPGATPKTLDAASGTWSVVEGKDAGRDGLLVMQKRKGVEGQFNVLLSSRMQVQDVDLRVKMRRHAGKIDQGGGLVWRAKDVKNYYVARYNPLEDNYRLYFVQNGRRAMIASADVKVDKAAWHTLRVTMHGARITCYLDGTAQLKVRDRTFRGAGKVGLWTKADAVTWFDNLEVTGK